MSSTKVKSHRHARSLDSIKSTKPSRSPKPSDPSPSMHSLTPRAFKVSCLNSHTVYLLTFRQDEEYEIVGYDQVAAGEDADLPSIVREAILKNLSDAIYDSVNDRVVYGNRLGVELLQGRESTGRRLDTLEKEVRKMKEDKAKTGLEERVEYLQNRVIQLSAASQGYALIRQRFLDTFRRDILKDPAAKHTETIRAGNVAAHDGDAVTDATLFTTGARVDADLMFKVYGLSADEVIALSKYPKLYR